MRKITAILILLFAVLAANSQEYSAKSDTATLEALPPSVVIIGKDTLNKSDKRYWKKALIKGKLNFKDTAVVYPRFIKFCVGVYNWCDKVFNTYDTAYVKGTGKRWKLFLRNENWLDSYAMNIGNGTYMTMASIPSSTIGAHISYMALSVGYSYSIGKIFNYKQGACKNFGFQFTCALFAAEFYHSTNNGGTIIRKFKYPGGAYYNIDLPGLQLKSYGADAYFFFNNKKYSHAAAYCYSKIQKKSAGSLIAGITLSRQSVGVDLSSVPKEIIEHLPEGAKVYNYRYNDFCLLFGYGYKWVFHKNWLLNGCAMPSAGLKYSFPDSVEGERYLFSTNIKAKLSITGNTNRFFYGLIGRFDGHWYKSKGESFFNSILFLTLNLGFRF